MFLKHAAMLAAGTSVFATRVRSAQTTLVTAETAYGRVRGMEIQGIRAFKGIPYGASTGGRNRFMPPRDPAVWTGVRDALEFGPSAPQLEPGVRPVVSDLAVAGRDLPPEGEDCLVLNVWTPGINDGGRRPVMLWCHGGGFAAGSGSSPVTDGSNLARRGDVVVVTINHRLNVLGFTSLADLGDADFESSSGTMGMLDIVQALQWVRENISQFGGDPNRVTIFGQSGGGRKVATLLTMPAARGLFHRAIIESGATLRLVEREQAAQVADALLEELELNRSQVRQLQDLPVERIMSAHFSVVRSMNVDQTTMGFSPVVDGLDIPRHPFYPDASDVSAEVPLMIGSTRTELTLSADDAAFELDEAAMRENIAGLLGGDADNVIEVYRRANPGATASDLYFLIASDYSYGAPVMKIAERRAALVGAGPVYLYYFRWESPFDGGRLKSPHTIEIPFVFHNIAASPLTASSPRASALADMVSGAWIAFARDGDPNTAALSDWPAFEPRMRPTMVFDIESGVENDPIRNERLAMFNAMEELL